MALNEGLLSLKTSFTALEGIFNNKNYREFTLKIQLVWFIGKFQQI